MKNPLNEAIHNIADSQLTDDPLTIVLGSVLLAVVCALHIIFIIRCSKRFRPDPWKVFCYHHEIKFYADQKRK